jgi:hypothetical protein
MIILAANAAAGEPAHHGGMTPARRIVLVPAAPATGDARRPHATVRRYRLARMVPDSRLAPRGEQRPGATPAPRRTSP